jgi:hypothetical protein
MMFDLSGTEERKWRGNLREEDEVDATVFLVVCAYAFDVKPHRVETLRDKILELRRRQPINLVEIVLQTFQNCARPRDQTDLSGPYDTFVNSSIEAEIDLSAIVDGQGMTPPQPCGGRTILFDDTHAD